MNRTNLLGVVLILVGSLLIYGGVKNKNPIELIKLALSGGDITKAAPLAVDINAPAQHIQLSPSLTHPNVKGAAGTALGDAANGVKNVFN